MDCLRAVRKLGHHRIANGLNDAALEGGECLGYQADLAVQHGQSRSVAVAVEVRRRSDDVGEDNREGCFVPPEFLVDLGTCL